MLPLAYSPRGEDNATIRLLTRGVMVTLQILVLSFWVRVLAGQHSSSILQLSCKMLFFNQEIAIRYEKTVT